MGLIAVCAAFSAVPSGAHAGSLTSCPSFTNQVNDSVSRFDAICGLTCPAWVEAGGIACEPPELVGLITTGLSMSPLAAAGCDTTNPTACDDNMNDIMNKLGDDSQGGGAESLSDLLKDPKYSDAIVDKENTPAVMPPSDTDSDTKIVITDPDVPDNPDTVIQYKKLCKSYSQDDAFVDDPNNPGSQIVNPALPAYLADIVAAGGYIAAGTQVCYVVRADDATAADVQFARRRSARVHSLLAPFARGSRLSAADNNTKFNLKFKSVVRVAGNSGEPKKRVTCGYSPFVVLTAVQVRDPSNPNKNIVAGQAAGRVCRVVVFLVRTPKLTAKESRLVKKGYGVYSFKLVGLPSKGSRERPVSMPFGRIKILSSDVRVVNGNSGGYVTSDDKGIAKWIGTVNKTGVYKVSGAWPFYKNQTSLFQLKTTLPPKKPAKKPKKK